MDATKRPWACEGEWQEAEDKPFTGYDERCCYCQNNKKHSWNEHYRTINEARALLAKVKEEGATLTLNRP